MPSAYKNISLYQILTIRWFSNSKKSFRVRVWNVEGILLSINPRNRFLSKIPLSHRKSAKRSWKRRSNIPSTHTSMTRLLSRMLFQFQTKLQQILYVRFLLCPLLHVHKWTFCAVLIRCYSLLTKPSWRKSESKI